MQKDVKEFYKKIEYLDVDHSDKLSRCKEQQEKVEYVLMKIPKYLESKVTKTLNGDNENINELKKRIIDLEIEIEKLKVPKKRKSRIGKSKEKEILELRKQGLSMNKIAKQVGVGDGTVIKILKEYNLK